MNKNKLLLYIMGFSCSILLGSLVYIWPEYKELWLFLQIVTLPGIYNIGYEILMDKQKAGMESTLDNVFEQLYKQDKKNQKLMLDNQRLISKVGIQNKKFKLTKSLNKG